MQYLVIMPDLRKKGHCKMMGGVCLSVSLSVRCLDLNRERKGLGSPQLAGLKPVNLKVKRSKVVTRPINAVTDNITEMLL